MKDFKGRVAIITGAASGFGKEFVRQAAKRKMKIVAVDIMEDELKKIEYVAKGVWRRGYHADSGRCVAL